MKKILLSEIITATGAKTLSHAQDIAVIGVSTDTRSLNRGDIFFALKGEDFDGHDFISMAQEKGACALVCSKDVQSDLPVLRVEDTIAALQRLAAHYRAKFSIPVIAITGSNGKTTTKNMLATVLSANYRVYYAKKNYNNEIGLPISILELDDSYDIAVLELGMNHFGEIEALTRIAKPDLAVITNIGMAHIGFLGSQENILKAKLEILAGLKAGGLLILNGDDPLLRGVTSPAHEVVFVGPEGPLSVSNIRADNDPSYFDLHYHGKTYACTLPTVGKYNVSNALLALYCGLRLGVRLEDAIRQLQRFTVTSMRTEFTSVEGITILKDCYNSSPDSAGATLEVLAKYSSHAKKIAILGEMAELGEFSEAEHRKLAKLCCSYQFDYVFFIGSYYRIFEQEIPKNRECFDKSERDSFAKALQNYVAGGKLKPGDIVLIKGSRSLKMEEFYDLLTSYIKPEKNDCVALPPSAAKLYIDTSAVKFNYDQIKKAVGEQVEILPMVKANAYGCGIDIIAKVFRDIQYLAVADVKEAALLRRVLPEANVLIIYQPWAGDIAEIVSQGYIASVSDLAFAERLNAQARKQAKRCNIHIEVDTGAGRLGLEPNQCLEFARATQSLAHLAVEGIFTHYSCADSYDESDLAFTKQQTALFLRAVADIESVLGEVRCKHACAGAAIFNPNAAHCNMVRPGYMLYGYYPSPALREKVPLKPALCFVSVILQIHDYPAGTAISYNRRFVTRRDSKIATVSVGYSDGLSRRLFQPGNEKNGCFVVNGQRAPIVGSICMDLTMIDITDIEGDVRVGDEVAIFDNSHVTIEEMAEICGTIGYEIIAQIDDKVERVERF